MTSVMMKDRYAMAKRLYCNMPGAQMPPIFDGEYAWGEVDATEHWDFCEAIATEILAAISKAEDA